MFEFTCDGSSVGRTSPCQGEGRRFESGPSLQKLQFKIYAPVVQW